MNSHKNARLTPRGRALLVARILDHGLRPEEAAKAAGVSVRTAYKWLRRFREDGADGLVDRTSRPHHCPHALPETTQAPIVTARIERQTYRQLSQTLKVGHSSAARVLVRAGLNRLACLEPAAPIQRYEYDAPGGMLHLDIKKLGRFNRPGHKVTADRTQNSRGAGWEYVHVAIDDHSRLAMASVHPDESAASACAALLQAVRYYRSLGIRFVRVLTDNGVAYRSRKFQRCTLRFRI